MLLDVYSKALEGGQSLNSIDEMDFLYFLDILIYRKYTDKKDSVDEVYGDTISL